MITKKLLLGLGAMLALSCSFNKEKLAIENFSVFFEEFSASSAFQKERIKFPLQKVEFD